MYACWLYAPFLSALWYPGNPFPGLQHSRVPEVAAESSRRRGAAARGPLLAPGHRTGPHWGAGKDQSSVRGGTMDEGRWISLLRWRVLQMWLSSAHTAIIIKCSCWIIFVDVECLIWSNSNNSEGKTGFRLSHWTLNSVSYVTRRIQVSKQVFYGRGYLLEGWYGDYTTDWPFCRCWQQMERL